MALLGSSLQILFVCFFLCFESESPEDRAGLKLDFVAKADLELLIFLFLSPLELGVQMYDTTLSSRWYLSIPVYFTLSGQKGNLGSVFLFWSK